ncbi:MAG: type VII secretion protein EccE, partial [Mycobacterium sp.]
MKAQRIFGLDLSWPRVTAVFLIDVAVLVLASHWPGESPADTYAWWSGVGIAVLVTITALTTYRRVPLTSALAARVLDRFADPEAILTEGRTRAVDHHRRYGRELVGIREYQDRLVAVIAVGGPAAEPSGRHHRGAASTVALPVEPVAAGLRQFDVRLDGIDIVSVGTRSAAGDDEGAAADAPGTPDAHSAPDHRNTWLVLRMDPQRNVGAVAARDSVASTLAAAAERLAHDLDGRRITAWVVTAEEFADLDTAVLAGLQPARVRQRRRRLKQKQPEGPKSFVTSFWVSPQDITSENLECLWLPETDTTAVTIRLVPRHGRTEVSVLVRYHSGGRLRREAWAGLNR